MPNTNNLNDLGYSPDALAQRKAELLTLINQTAPEVLSDNQQINVNKLKELLGEEHITGDEHYELSWAGKAAARREIQKTSSHTLLPDPSNPANAQHMLIEGENLEVLRVLQKSYYGKLKMIYIDPPYNTGNDNFLYPDDYSETIEEYQKRTGEKNEAGFLNKQSLWKKNSKESGQYHSAWLSMMYPRLYLARNLLRDDGVIFISIDDNEVANLKLLCDEIFGERNFIEIFSWQKTSTPPNLSKKTKKSYEYILAYQKLESGPLVGLSKSSNSSNGLMNQTNPVGVLLFPADYVNTKLSDGIYRAGIYGTEAYRIELLDDTQVQDGLFVKPIHLKGKFKWSQSYLDEQIASGVKIFIQTKAFSPSYTKDQYEPEKPWNIINKDFGVGTNENAGNEVDALFEKNFSESLYPKPSSLIKYLINTNVGPGDCVMDFFAGSGSTMQSVMEINLEDCGNRQCICVQIPELLDASDHAYSLGYRTIADITRARIEKVIAKINSENPNNLAGTACASFTLAPSNFKAWRSDVTNENDLRDQLVLFQSAEKRDTNQKPVGLQTAVLTELLLKHGLGALGVHAISEPKQMAGVTVHRVLMQDDRRLWLCFDTYTEALKEEIVKARPAQVILLNSCFVGDKADELLSNLQLELSGLDIGLTVI